jgi:dTDP-4-dehydrorhamnose reductase
MKVLITGSKGQLGMSIEKLSPEFPDYQFIYTDVEELDITKADDIRKFIAENKPEVIINCAAYTAVDKAEEEPEKAHLLNVTAPGLLAKAASENNILLIHISTDFIFGGDRKTPYKEEDKAVPESVYAKTKADGEQAVIKNSKRAVIFRTSWLYSEFGHNFAKTILRLAKERPEINVVDDQIGTPTYATDLAEIILNLLPELNKPPRGTEILHFSNEGIASWYDFAKEIVQQSGLKCKVNPISTEEYPLPAKRPAYSVLNKSKIKSKYGIEIPDWEESLGRCLKEIQNKI